MAELVHLRLEHGLRELEEMERVKLFTRDEIRKIAKKRKMFEYRLRRRNSAKEDFLQYIEFEICLLLLISKRRERLLVESKKKEIDNSIAKKVNRLFKAVVSKYPEDEKLWLNQIQYFKRMKWYDSLSALYAKVVQVHSKKPEVWIQAAKWEMEDNDSISNARKLLQRGIVTNRSSESLWKELFRLELKNMEQCIKESEAQGKNSELKISTFCEVLNAVFDEAIKEIPDPEYGLSFLSICFECEYAEKSAEYILHNIQKMFPLTEEILDAVAKEPLIFRKKRVDRLKKEGFKEKDANRLAFTEIQSKYDEAVTKVPTEKMWSFYLDFLFSKLETCKGEKSKEKVKNIILNKMEEAAESNCLSKKYHLEYVNLLKNSHADKALFVARTAAHKWNTVDVWIACLLLYIQCRQSKEIIYQLFTEGLSNVNKKDSIKIWNLGVDWLTMSDPEKLIEFFEKGITETEKISSPLKEMYLESTALRDGIEAARKLYKRFKAMGTMSLLLYKKMLKIERAQLKPSLTHIRSIYEDVIKDYGHNNVDAWIEFMQFEATCAQNPQSFEMLQWRGKKTLRPELVGEFQRRITSLLTGGQTFTDEDLVDHDD